LSARESVRQKASITRVTLERCPRCLLHLRLCLCSIVAPIELATRVVVLRHRREFHKPTNTGRLVPIALGASEVRTFDDMLQLGRVATSFDLTSSLTIVPAVSYIRGPNATGPGASTSILGFDFYGKWKPLSNDHGWPFVTLQAEWMQRDLDAAAQELEDGTILPSEQLVDRGLYLQGTWGFTRRWVAGLRFDWFEGDESPYTDRALDPLRDRRERWSTNLSFFPSEFSKLRLQYNWDDSEFFDADGSSLVLQFEYLYGAHGGHKF